MLKGVVPLSLPKDGNKKSILIADVRALNNHVVVVYENGAWELLKLNKDHTWTKITQQPAPALAAKKLPDINYRIGVLSENQFVIYSQTQEESTLPIWDINNFTNTESKEIKAQQTITIPILKDSYYNQLGIHHWANTATDQVAVYQEFGNPLREIGLFGKRSPEKGHEELLRLCPLTKKEIAENTHRTMIGMMKLPNGGLACGFLDNTIRFWSPKVLQHSLAGESKQSTPEPEIIQTGHRGPLGNIASLNSNHLATICLQGEVFLWDLHSKKRLTASRLENNGNTALIPYNGGLISKQKHTFFGSRFIFWDPIDRATHHELNCNPAAIRVMKDKYILILDINKTEIQFLKRTARESCIVATLIKKHQIPKAIAGLISSYDNEFKLNGVPDISEASAKLTA